MSEDVVIPQAPANRGRFTKGVCPNPKGRPRKSKSFDDSMRTALNTKVTVNEGGKKRKVENQILLTMGLKDEHQDGGYRVLELADLSNGVQSGL